MKGLEGALRRFAVCICIAVATVASGQGVWTTNAVQWPVAPIHMVLLPNHNLLLVNRTRNDSDENIYRVALIPPPYTGAGMVIDPPMDGPNMRELFCAGHTLDENGDALFAGGHAGHASAYDRIGIRDVWLYKWRTNTWERQQDMPHARWYPTVLQLPNRTFLTMMGEYSDSVTPGAPISINTTPDLWTAIPGGSSPTNLLVPVTTRHQDVYYPHTFIHPVNGRPFYAASGLVGIDLQGQSCLFNLETLAWESYAPIPNGFPNIRRAYPSSVMMDGVIYRSGGSRSDNQQFEAERVATKIDLYAPTPQWTSIDSMKLTRKNHTLVALPDGRIVAMGGNVRAYVEQSNERTTPEVYDPEAAVPEWRLLSPIPSNQPNIGRGYHLCSLLLPDASIISAGAEREYPNPIPWTLQRRAQIFTPEYGNQPNWENSRPAFIGRPPASIRYGEDFYIDVELQAGRTLSKLRLISLGSTTHAFNENQQYVTLGFSPHPTIAGRYIVHAPESSFKATPGYFMLFAVDSARIPSIAHTVQLKDFERRFPYETEVLEGMASTPPQITQTALGDNQYCGTALESSASGTVSLRVRASYASTGFSKFRMFVECRSSLNTNYRWWLKNNWTSAEELVSTGTTTTIDRLFSQDLVSSGCPYVAADGQVEARLEWQGITPLTPFQVYVDRIEFGVRPLNDQDPVLGRIESQTVEEGQLVSVPISATDADVPPQALTYSLGSNAPLGATMSSNGLFTWIPGEEDGGHDRTVSVQVSDGFSSDSASFTVHVLERNEAPTLEDIGDKSIDELQQLAFNATASDSDLPAQTLSYSLDPGAPEGAAITSNGVFMWTPNEGQGAGTYSVTIRVRDEAGGEDAETIHIAVREVNVAPELDPISNFSIVEGSLAEFTAHAVDSDLPANGLSYSLIGLVPPGAAITADGHFTWIPTESQGPGAYTFGVKVSDTGTPSLGDVHEVSIFVQEQLQGAPVDLVGTYLAPAGPGTVFAGTAAKGGERVREMSHGRLAPDATFTPYSDAIKPPSEWIPNMSGESVGVDIAVSGSWGDAAFQIGLETMATGTGSLIQFTRTGNLVSAQLLRLDGSYASTPALDLTGATVVRAKLVVDAAGDSMSAWLTTLDGSAPGTEISLGEVTTGLGEAAFFFAGYSVPTESSGTAKAVISNFATTADRNVMALQATNPFVRTDGSITYRLSQANIAEEVGGYQCFLEAHGPQAFVSGSYSEEPYTMSLGGAQYDPIRAVLYLARGIAFASSARLDDALLATLNFQPTGEGASKLTIRPDNGWGLDTTFADNGLLGLFIAPTKRDSDTVVIDGTPPVLSDVEVTQEGHDVLTSGLIKQGPLKIAVDVQDALSGLASHPVATLDFEPLGENHGEDVVAAMSPEESTRFQFETLMTLERDCMRVQIRIAAQDDCANIGLFSSPTLEVNQSTLLLHIRHPYGWAGEEGLVRGLEIRLGSGPGTANPTILDRDVTFDEHGDAFLELDGSDGVCAIHSEISVKDPLHGLRTKISLGGTSPHFTATVDLRQGDISKDNKVDIMDYVVLAMRYGLPVSPATPYPHAPTLRHADLDGDGEVGLSDYALLSAAFGSIGATDVGNYRPGGPPTDRIRTIDAVSQLGIEVKRYDRNRDGWITIKELGF